MHEFHRADPVLTKLLGPQRLRPGSVYVRSPFTVLVEEGGVRHCYSTLTKQGLTLPSGFDPAGRYDGAAVAADPTLRALAEGYFLRPADRDETKFYGSVAAMMRAFRARKGLASFVILPTMACNARCTYCYEEGCAPVTMSRETARNTLDFILRSRRPNTRLFLQWFGGEPLLGVETVDFLLSGLRAAGVEYRCGFTTNGSLITPALAERMAGEWHTANVQLTLDGTEETYRRIKRYVRWEDTYRRVLENINLLAGLGVTVNLRINLDGSNDGEVEGILRDLSQAVKARDRVYVYVAPIYQLRRSEQCLEIWNRATALTRLILEAGFRTAELIGLDTRFRTFRCMASNPGANLLITPEGRLSCCEHQLEGPLYGTVTEGITEPEALRAFSDASRIPEKCRDCPFLPDCTGFHSCPVYDFHCREARMLKARTAILSMLEQTAQAEDDEALQEQLFFTD